MSTQTGLQRIICIDGHIPSKVMEIRVAEHANLSGTNGAGKTTLLKLIPCFYGASPGQIVQKVGKRRSFVDYYLPRSTSLLIFEYSNHRGLMCVVVYRHSSGDKPAYRFLGERFAIEYFSESQSSDVTFVEGKNLGSHWTQLYLEHSRQLERVTDYRGVIQGDRSLINRSSTSRELTQMVAMYSLTGTLGKMKHMDKLSNAILGRSGDMDRIKEMLADIMREEGISLPLIKPHKDMANTMAELRTLRELDAQQNLLRQTVSKGTLYFDNAQRLNEVHAELDQFRQLKTDQINETDKKIAALDVELKVLNAQWDAQERELSDVLSTSRLNYQTADKALECLLRERSTWDEEDIEQKKVQYEQLENYREECEQAMKRLDLLNEDVEEVKQDFEKKRAEEFERYQHGDEKLRIKLQTAQDQYHFADKTWADKNSNLQLVEIEAKHALKKKQQVEIDDSNSEINALSYQARHSTYTDDEKRTLELAEQARDLADEQHQYALNSMGRVQDELRQKKTLLDNEHIILQKSDRDLSEATQLFDELNRRCNPPAGTFHAELRANQADWHESLGRIIREDLLDNKNLSPLFENTTPGNESVLGWRLDFQKLEKPHWAVSEVDQQAALAEQEGIVSLAIRHKNKCEESVSAANKVWEQSKMRVDEAMRDFAKSQTQKQATKEALTLVKNENKETAYARKTVAVNKLQRLQGQLDALQQRFEQDLQKQADLARAQRNEEIALASIELSRIKKIIEGLEQSIEKGKRQHRENIKSLDGDFKALCSERGVDEKRIQAADADYKEARQALADVKNLQAVVNEYERWFKTYWIGKDQCVQAVSDAQEVLARQERELAAEKRDYINGRDGCNAKKTALNTVLREDRGEQEEARMLLAQLIRPLSKVSVEACRPLAMISAETRTLIEMRAQLKVEIKSGINKADGIICRGGDNNQVAAAWSYLRDEQRNKLSDPDDLDALSINLTMALETLLDVHLPQIRELLLSFVENIGGQLAGFFIGLKEVEKAIVSQSRRISESISSSVHFDAISDIRVALVSRIATQDYWPELEEFHRAWQSWKQENGLDLPSEEMDAHIISSCEILYRSNMNQGIESVFDLEISLRQNGQAVTVMRSADLENVSSTGLSYLILCSIFAGITRMLCPDRTINLHWPMDELGTLAAENISRLFVMLNDYNIIMVGGFPTTDPLLLQHFKVHHEIKKGVGLVELVLKEDKLSRIIRQRAERQGEE